MEGPLQVATLWLSPQYICFSFLPSLFSLCLTALPPCLPLGCPVLLLSGIIQKRVRPEQGIRSECPVRCSELLAKLELRANNTSVGHAGMGQAGHRAFRFIGCP